MISVKDAFCIPSSIYCTGTGDQGYPVRTSFVNLCFDPMFRLTVVAYKDETLFQLSVEKCNSSSHTRGKFTVNYVGSVIIFTLCRALLNRFD